MGRSELITNISQKTGMTKADCERMLDAFSDTVKESLVNGEKIIIKGFMSMEVAERAERSGRNPKTGKIDIFPAVKTVKCKIAKAIKDAVNEKQE
jgi:DNA-binding protein HU-beta